MSLAPVLALFHKLLGLCRREGSHALSWLLKLFSLLSRRIGLVWSSDERKQTDEGSELLPVRDVSTSGTSNSVNTHGPSSVIRSEQAVVLACSSAPSTPPQARTRPNRWTESSAYFPRSPTSTLNSFNSFSGLDAIKEVDAIEFGAYRAEPEPLCASPIEPQRKRNIKSIGPSERPRYDRNVPIGSIQKGWVMKPLSSYEIFRNKDVGSWKQYVHPEGQPYYKRDLGRFSYLTEANLQDEGVLAEVESFMNEIEACVEKFERDGGHLKGVYFEVVLEIQDGWTYYMVDLDNQIVFWLHDYDISTALGCEFGVESQDQFIEQLKFEYWVHIEQFPNHQHLDPVVFDEVMGILNYWRIDIISSADSTSPYDQWDLDCFIKSVKHLQDAKKRESESVRSCATTSLARMMGIVANERHHNFFGSNGARLQIWQSVRGNLPKKRSWLVRYLSPVLFYAPETHLSGLERLWVDGVIKDRMWKKYQLKLERDWESFVLTSTVLLNANVALLSTPIVLSDNGDNGILFASPAAVASQVSIVASLASIIIGLLLVRQIRISAKDIDITATDAINYLSNRKSDQLGLETMAIQYSLPYALLMWGMLTFLASIVVACFYKVDGTPNTLSQIIYAVVWLFVVPLILWTVITGWETNNKRHWSEMFSADWWKNVAQLRWGRPEKETPWTWRLRRKAKKDVESHSRTGSDASVGGEVCTSPRSETSSETATSMRNRKNWRVRVRNFGPVRRLTFNPFARSDF